MVFFVDCVVCVGSGFKGEKLFLFVNTIVFCFFSFKKEIKEVTKNDVTKVGVTKDEVIQDEVAQDEVK